MVPVLMETRRATLIEIGKPVCAEDRAASILE
jgi:hypothetical protein